MKENQQQIKPDIWCPHCEESFNAGDLASRSVGKTELGVGVFSCPLCNGQIKIEPAEYMLVTKGLRTGEYAQGAGIEAYKSDELTPSERRAMRDHPPKRYVPLVMGIVGLGLAVTFLFGFGGWWRYIPATIFVAYGLFSIRVALFASDRVVRKLTD